MLIRVVCLITLLCSLAPCRLPAQQIDIPFRYDPSFLPYIIVSVRIDDHPPLPFLIDTGSTASLVLDTEAARQLNLHPNRGRGLVNHSIEMESVTVSGVALVGPDGSERLDCVPTDAHILDLHLLDEVYTGPRIAGIIGAPMLAQYAVRFDFARHLMSIFLSGAAPAPAADATTVPLRGWDGKHSLIAWLDGSVGVRLLVDTGSPTTSLPISTLSALHPQATTLSSYQQLGSEVIGDRWRLKTLKIGEIEEPEIAVNAAPDYAYAVLGLDLMCRFRVTLDFPHETATLERASDYAARVGLTGWTGIELEGAGRGYRVRTVQEASPAAGAGITPGHELIAVEGYPLAGLPITVAERLLNGRAGTLASLLVRQGKSLHTVDLRRGSEFERRPGALGGVTLQRREGGRLSILRVTPNSLSDRAGLAPDDEVISLNGTPTANLTADETRRRLEGPRLTLQVRRRGHPRPVQIDLPPPTTARIP